MIPSQQFTKFFTLKGDTGQLRNADTLPDVKVYKEEIETSIVVSVVPSSIGHYAAQFMVPTNWIEGDNIFLKISATIQGYQQEAFVSCGQVSPSSDEVVNKTWESDISTVTAAGSAAKELKSKLDKKNYLPPFI